jgi:hypothetical protein
MSDAVVGGLADGTLEVDVRVVAAIATTAATSTITAMPIRRFMRSSWRLEGSIACRRG